MSSLKESLYYEDPSFDKLPDIKLYMDQMLDYLKINLEVLMRSAEDSVFTKTMINNYVKSGIIDAPTKKKYPKSTVADLVLVYHLKQCFSIQDTHTILDILRIESSYYTEFTKLHKIIRASLHAELPSDLDDLDPDMAKALLMQYAIEASVKKRMAELLLDHLNLNKIVKP